MAEPIPLFEKKPSVVHKSDYTEKNISYARQWYKKKRVPSLISFKLSDAGSSYGGTIKNGILQIVFTPEFHVLWSGMATSISTTQEELDFRFELERDYNKILDHFQKMEEKREKGTLKLSVTPKSLKGVITPEKKDIRS